MAATWGGRAFFLMEHECRNILKTERMTKNINIMIRQLATRGALALLGVAGFILDAAAGNKVTMDNFSMKIDEEQTVAICLDNDELMSALQLDITLPAGVHYVANSITRDEARLDRDTHSIHMGSVGNSTYRLLIVPSGTDNIVGNSGAVAYFKVRATSVLLATANIELTNIYGSSNEKDPETGYTKKFEMDDYTVEVSPNVGHLFFVADTVSLKNDGTSKKVEVGLVNYVALRGLQAELTLPAGLSLEAKESGRPVFEYGARVPQNMSITSNYNESDGKWHLALSGLTTEMIAADSSMLFSFYVKATEELAESSVMALGEVVVADGANHGIGVYKEDGIRIINAFIAYYTPANDSVQAVRARYEAAVERIDAEAANAKDSTVIVEGLAGLAARIEAVQEAVEEAYAGETLKEGFDAVLAPLAVIDTDITALVDEALRIQSTVDANEAAYTRLTADIAAVQAKLDAAKATMEADYAEVAGQFTADIFALQEDIDSISDEVTGLYDEVKLTVESQIDATAIEAGIEKLLADAAAALATEEAKKANEEAYTRLTADIAVVQAKLDAAMTTIETDYADVAEQFTADISALQEDIDFISNEVKGLYDEVKLTAESQIDATAIEAGIEKVLADAKKAHEGSSIAGVKGPEGAELLGIYTVSGKRVAAPLKGQVNIFKYSDGTVKKFYMK